MDKIDQILNKVDQIIELNMKNSSPWCTVKETAAYLKMSNRSIRRYITNGLIKIYKLPTGGVRIRKADIDSLVMYGKPFKKLTTTQRKQIFTK